MTSKRGRQGAGKERDRREGRGGIKVGKGIVEMEGKGRVKRGGRNEDPTTTEGERRRTRIGKRREGRAGRGFVGPMLNCFLRA